MVVPDAGDVYTSMYIDVRTVCRFVRNASSEGSLGARGHEYASAVRLNRAAAAASRTYSFGQNLTICTMCVKSKISEHTSLFFRLSCAAEDCGLYGPRSGQRVGCHRTTRSRALSHSAGDLQATSSVVS